MAEDEAYGEELYSLLMRDDTKKKEVNSDNMRKEDLVTRTYLIFLGANVSGFYLKQNGFVKGFYTDFFGNPVFKIKRGWFNNAFVTLVKNRTKGRFEIDQEMELTRLTSSRLYYKGDSPLSLEVYYPLDRVTVNNKKRRVTSLGITNGRINEIFTTGDSLLMSEDYFLDLDGKEWVYKKPRENESLHSSQDFQERIRPLKERQAKNAEEFKEIFKNLRNNQEFKDMF